MKFFTELGFFFFFFKTFKLLTIPYIFLLTLFGSVVLKISCTLELFGGTLRGFNAQVIQIN